MTRTRGLVPKTLVLTGVLLAAGLRQTRPQYLPSNALVGTVADAARGEVIFDAMSALQSLMIALVHVLFPAHCA